MRPPASLSQTLITGVYRSGTSFLSELLGGHPNLSATMYHVNAPRFLWDRYDPITAPANLRCAVQDTAERLHKRYNIILDQDAVLDLCRTADAVTYGVLYDALMRTLWLNGERRHWSEKCQLVWREIPRFLDVMPNGRAIMIVRDPRSVLASFKHFTYAPPPAYLGAIFNCFDAFQAAERYGRELPKDRFRLVRYEDAAQDPQRTRRDLLTFIGVDPALSGDMPALNINSPFSDGAASFDIDAAIQRWRKHLSPAEIAATELVCKTQMERLGYPCTTAQDDVSDALRLFLQDDMFTAHLRHVIVNQRGIQAFPTDPLAPENWTENRAAKPAGEAN